MNIWNLQIFKLRTRHLNKCKLVAVSVLPLSSLGKESRRRSPEQVTRIYDEIALFKIKKTYHSVFDRPRESLEIAFYWYADCNVWTFLCSFVKVRLQGDFCRATRNNCCRALSCNFNMTFDFSEIYRHDIVGVSNLLGTWCNLRARKIGLSRATKTWLKG